MHSSASDMRQMRRSLFRQLQVRLQLFCMNPEASQSLAAYNYFIDVAFDYVAKMPIKQADGSYRDHTVKYRANGQWRY